MGSIFPLLYLPLPTYSNKTVAFFFRRFFIFLSSFFCLSGFVLGLLFNTLHKKMKSSIKDFFSKCDQTRRFPPDLVTFTEEVFNRKLHFLCSDTCPIFQSKVFHFVTAALLFSKTCHAL